MKKLARGAPCKHHGDALAIFTFQRLALWPKEICRQLSISSTDPDFRFLSLSNIFFQITRGSCHRFMAFKGGISLRSCCILIPSSSRSKSFWSPNQNRGEFPKNVLKRRAASAVTLLLPLIISEILVSGILVDFANLGSGRDVLKKLNCQIQGSHTDCGPNNGALLHLSRKTSVYSEFINRAQGPESPEQTVERLGSSVFA
jgi:hypothetical protein